MALVALFVTPGKAHAVGSYNNAAIADIAIQYEGGFGGAACVAAGRSGATGGTPLGSGDNDDGECKAFVNCIVRLASGGTQWPAPGYASGFLGAGAAEVTEGAAVKGDIIQWGTGVHTAIVVANSGGGSFAVVDSNWSNNHKVQQHSMNVHRSGWPAPRFFRLGTVIASPPPDADGDGVPNSADRCPNEAGSASLNGCPDLDHDAIADVDDQCDLFPGPLNTHGCPSEDFDASSESDFNGDRRSDVAAFYDYGTSSTGLWRFTGAPVGLVAPASKADRTWLSGDGNWSLGRTRLVSGDFNGDGPSDVAAFYDYGSGNTGLWRFVGSSDGLVAPSGVADRTWLSGAGNWSLANSRFVAGDFNGDSMSDVAAFYDYGSSTTGLWRFQGSPNGLTAPTSAAVDRTWMSGTGNWSLARTRFVSGDFDGDRISDVAAFYDYGSSNTGLWRFKGSPGGLTAPSSAAGDRTWMSGTGNWSLARTRFVSGDFNGDGTADVAAFYDYGSSSTGLWRFQGSPNGLTAPSSAAGDRTWMSGTGNWSLARTRFSSGDFNGDGYADVAAFYDYGSGNTGLWRFLGSPAGLVAPSSSADRTWMSGAGNWSLASTRFVGGTGVPKLDPAAAGSEVSTKSTRCRLSKSRVRQGKSVSVHCSSLSGRRTITLRRGKAKRSIVRKVKFRNGVARLSLRGAKSGRYSVTIGPRSKPIARLRLRVL